jgi:hypothetical protein
MASRPDIIITNKKRRTYRCGTTCGQYHRKGIGNESKIEELMFGDKKEVEYEMYVYTDNDNLGHLESTPGKHSTDSLQKTAILGTSHIIRKVL